MKFLPLFLLLSIPYIVFAFTLKSVAEEESHANSIAVFVVSNIKEKGHFGDRSQSSGIKQAILKMLKKQGHDAEGIEVDVHDLDSLKTQIKERSHRSIVISSGNYGIKAMHELKEDKETEKKVMTIWSGHQEFAGLRDNLSSLNAVIIPKYVVTTRFKLSAWSSGTKLIEVDFIPHSLNLNKLKFAYDKFKHKKEIPLDKSYTILLFGGDAPDSSGKVLNIKDKEIHKMAQRVSKIVQENKSTLIIANSYRTKPAQVALFLNNIKAAGIEDSVFFDFHKNIRSYKALLYLISRGNASIVTGDSISMIDESIQFSKKPVYVEKVSSMNENHKKHLDFMKESKDAMLLEEYSEDNLDYKTPPFAAKIIAKQLQDSILEFLKG